MFVVGLKLLAVELLIRPGRLPDRCAAWAVGLAEKWMGEVGAQDNG